MSFTPGNVANNPKPANVVNEPTPRIPKFGTLIPNRIFVGGISIDTTEADLAHVFSAFGNVKSSKIIMDRSGVSKGYGFVTFETEEEAQRLQSEKECVFLKNRKLNIGPAIRKAQAIADSIQYNAAQVAAMRTLQMQQLNGGFYATGPAMPGIYSPDIQCNPYYQYFGVPPAMYPY